MTMKAPSFRHFVEHEMGQLPYIFIYSVLEITLMAILLLDGSLAYLATLFADLFDLVPPCLLCTRLSPLFDRADHYSTAICESHKKEISSFAYCNVHCKVSDLSSMCEACNIGGLVNEKQGCNVCSCCGEAIKAKSSSVYQKNVGFGSNLPIWVAQTPCSSPSTAFTPWKNEEAMELKFPKPNVSPPGEDEAENVSSQVKEDVIIPPVLQESEETAEEFTTTPSFTRGGSRLFSMLSGDSTTASPRFAPRTPRKYVGEIAAPDLFEDVGVNEPEDSVVNRLKQQLKQDRNSLIAVSQELDEERSASAVAANNAMAMITRLQADKASVQMEALQYQRMMDEQSEYDQEALSVLHDLLEKREYEMLDMQDELELYRERYGVLRDVVKRSENFDKSQSFSSFTERSDPDDDDDNDGSDDQDGEEDDGHVSPDESVFDIETDVDPDPSINYYDQDFALYEKQLQEQELKDGDHEDRENEEMINDGGGDSDLEHKRSIILENDDQYATSENDDQYATSENDRVPVVGEEEDEDAEKEATVNDSEQGKVDTSDQLNMAESIIENLVENDPNEEASNKENDRE